MEGTCNFEGINVKYEHRKRGPRNDPWRTAKQIEIVSLLIISTHTA